VLTRILRPYYLLWQRSARLSAWLALAGVLLLLGLGCRGSSPPAPASGPALSEAVIRGTWVWQAVFAEGIADEVFVVLAGRWLGGVEASWVGPGQARSALEAATASAPVRLVAQRQLREDVRAFEHLKALHAHASCRLAQDPDSFGAAVPEGYRLGAAACKALGDVDSAKVASSHAGAPAADPAAGEVRSSPGGTADADVASLLVPQVKVLDVRGERLEYVLLQPSQIQAAAQLLASWVDAAAVPQAVDGDLASFLAEAAGTTRWSMSSAASSELLLSAEAVLASAAAGSGRLGEVESSLEETILHWQTGLASLPRDGEQQLDAGGRALLDRWFRRALYRDVGLAALEQKDPEVALVALEEATGARGRVRPGAGLDPLLLVALARARYECNELQRAVELLDDIASVPGWELAAPVARTIARVAVVGSGADAKVNR